MSGLYRNLRDRNLRARPESDSSAARSVADSRVEEYVFCSPHRVVAQSITQVCRRAARQAQRAYREYGHIPAGKLLNGILLEIYRQSIGGADRWLIDY